MGKAIYKLDWDFGRMGSLEGVFVADSDDIKKLIDSKTEIYFGEVLGKHSEVIGVLKEKYLTKVTEEPNIIEMFQTYGFENGYNPFDYIDGSDDENDEDDVDED